MDMQTDSRPIVTSDIKLCDSNQYQLLMQLTEYKKSSGMLEITQQKFYISL